MCVWAEGAESAPERERAGLPERRQESCATSFHFHFPAHSFYSHYSSRDGRDECADRLTPPSRGPLQPPPSTRRPLRPERRRGGAPRRPPASCARATRPRRASGALRTAGAGSRRWPGPSPGRTTRQAPAEQREAVHGRLVRAGCLAAEGVAAAGPGEPHPAGPEPSVEPEERRCESGVAAGSARRRRRCRPGGRGTELHEQDEKTRRQEVQDQLHVPAVGEGRPGPGGHGAPRRLPAGRRGGGGALEGGTEVSQESPRKVVEALKRAGPGRALPVRKPRRTSAR